jgi:UDP-N-acetylmuramoyl-tripeptide--D-alanyl-D-alanine ligase
MRVPVDVAARTTNARLLDGAAAPKELRVSTDTRAIEPGDTFVALHGERFDGHDFTSDAVGRGAAMVVIDDDRFRVPGAAAMLVTDTKTAYMKLAAASRDLFAGQVLAITGSAGKTTTKTFLAALLTVKYGDRVLVTPANENNEIGVSKLLLSASNSAHDVIVVEMGARHYGDIAALVEIARPDVAILTNVGDAHVEIMGSRERLEEAKWALFSRGARAVLNAGDTVSRRRAAMLDRAPHWFAAQSSTDATAAFYQLSPLTAVIGDRLIHRDANASQEYDIDVRLPGLHNRANLAAAIAGALELDLRPKQLLDEIPRLRLPQGRYDRIGIRNGAQLIYDAYNANASGTIAALDAFGEESAARRIAVLASMAELGEESKALHERVGAHAARRVDVLLACGDHAVDLARGATRGGLAVAQIVVLDTNAQAAQWLRDHARADDVVLLKGSRKYKLEEIVEALRS